MDRRDGGKGCKGGQGRGCAKESIEGQMGEGPAISGILTFIDPLPESLWEFLIGKMLKIPDDMPEHDNEYAEETCKVDEEWAAQSAEQTFGECGV